MSPGLKRTPLYSEHLRLGARMVEFAGFELPIQYVGVKAEHLAVREAAGVFDVSHMGELRIVGDGALEAVNQLVTNDLTRAPDGKAVYAFCCNEEGGILDDLIVYRLHDDEIFVVCNASNRTKIRRHFERELATSGCSLRDESDDTALLAVQGPQAVSCVTQLCADSTLPLMPKFTIRRARLADIECQVARTGYTGEDGFEIFCAWDDAPRLFNAVTDQSTQAAARVTPAGLAARDTLRLEARLLLYGNDIDETSNPYEAGFGWVVKLEKADFVGKAALARIHDAGPARRLIGFEMLGRGIARPGYPLLNEERVAVGRCTSGSPSPTLGTAIGLGYVPADLSHVGQTLYVDCRGKLIQARVVETPFYQRAKG